MLDCHACGAFAEVFCPSPTGLEERIDRCRAEVPPCTPSALT